MTKKILIIRNDRLGDIVLALPSILLLKELHPHSEIYFLASPAVAPLLEHINDIHEVIVSESGNNSQIVRKLKEINISTAFCLYPTFQNVFNLVRAIIPERVGTSRRWYSLLFTKRLNISRRGGKRHEALLNLDLISQNRKMEQYPFPEIAIPAETLKSIGKLLKSINVQDNKPIVILHPGSGLSAVNWSILRFRELAKLLVLNESVEVVITGIASESELCKEVAIEGSANLCGQTDLIGMSALIHKSAILISNSTGPLHLAIALGCKVIGLYPPKRDCLPERWGPYMHPEWAVMPDLPICNNCKPGKFSDCSCMEEITVESVYDKSLELLGI